MNRSDSNSPLPPDTSRSIAGQFLMFIGPIVTMAGALAIFRTGEKTIFYLALMPIGLVMWIIGFRLRQLAHQRNGDAK